MANKKLQKDMRTAANSVLGNGSMPSNGFSFDLSSADMGGGGAYLNISPLTLIGGATSSPSVSALSPVQSAYNATHYPDMTTSQRYSYLLSTPNDTLWAVPFFVASSDGSVFYGTPDAGIAFLTIADIQGIENATNTAGTLLLKLQQPAIAKATAGYSGANNSSTSTTVVSDPIPQVQTLPPVQTVQTTTTTAVTPNTGTGVVDGTQMVFTDTGTTAPPADTSTTNTTPPLPQPVNATTTTGTAQQSMTGAGGKYWWLWYLLAAVAIILYLKFRK